MNYTIDTQTGYVNTTTVVTPKDQSKPAESSITYLAKSARELSDTNYLRLQDIVTILEGSSGKAQETAPDPASAINTNLYHTIQNLYGVNKLIDVIWAKLFN
jgi:hypothetical protein